MSFNAWRASTAFLVLAGTIATAQDESPLQMRVHHAGLASSLDDASLMPWHLKLSVQLYDLKGIPTEQGTVEEWWSGPGMERIVYTFPSYAATVVRNKDGVFRTAGRGLAPYYVDYMRRQVVHPMPGEEELQGATPDLRKETFSKVDFDCIMLTQPIKMVAFPPLGLFPTYCFERGKDGLRITSDFGSQVTIRRRIGKFQGREVPLDLEVASNGVKVANSHIESLSGQAKAFDETLLTEGLEGSRIETAKISGAVIAGNILNKVQPIYPLAARQRHVSGSVVLRAIIGTDGHVYSLRPMSSPDPDLAIASIAAVRQWTYKPYLLNGEPTEVDTTITVNFSLGP